MEKWLLCALLFSASHHFLATITDARTVQNLKVFPAILSERSSTNKISMRIHDNFMLNLEKSSVFSDKFQFITHTENSKVTYHINASDVEHNLYHDTEKDAAIMITDDDDDGLRVEGILGDTLRIRPSSVIERNAEGHVAHELFEVQFRHPGGDDTFYVERRDASTFSGGPITPLSERSGSGYLRTVSPEVHVVIDKAHTTHFKLKSKILEYLAIFMAAVNLKYRTLRYVDLQLVVTKVTLFNNVSEPFITKSEHNPTVMMGETLSTFSTYVGKTEDFKNDDMVVLLTGMDIGYVDLTTNKSYGLGISGLANLGGACGLWTRGALVEDVPKTFSGVVTFAHECGHLLGIAHDGSPPQTYVNGNIGAERCPASDRYIMSPLMGVTSIYKFSYCSEQQLYMFVGRTDPGLNCLRNNPRRHTARVSLQRWNKTLVSPVEVCKLEYPNHSILQYLEIYPGREPAQGMATCHIVCEATKDARTAYLIINAPDGMPCDKTDPNKVCINKECVNFPTDIFTLTKRPQRSQGSN